MSGDHIWKNDGGCSKGEVLGGRPFIPFESAVAVGA